MSLTWKQTSTSMSAKSFSSPCACRSFNVFRLFRRPRWTQEPIPASSPAYALLSGPLFTHFRYRLGGRDDIYDARVRLQTPPSTLWTLMSTDRRQSNQDIWGALQPSLRIATKVLRSTPPAWLAFLNFTRSLRKVPIDVDGRTDQQKASQDYRQYRSLWLNDDTTWDEYASAKALNAICFESGKATMAVLRRGE